MARKHDYVLIVGPTDTAGNLAVSHADLENQVSVIQLSGFMDYSSLGVWRGELVLRPFDAGAIRRAEARLQVWPKELLEAYPPDFDDQMKSLDQRLADQPGRLLEVSAVAHGGDVRLTCLSAST